MATRCDRSTSRAGAPKPGASELKHLQVWGRGQPAATCRRLFGGRVDPQRLAVEPLRPLHVLNRNRHEVARQRYFRYLPRVSDTGAAVAWIGRAMGEGRKS